MEDLYELEEAFTERHLETKWNWDTERQELVYQDALLDILQAVKLKEIPAVGSGTGAPTIGSRVNISLTAVDIQQDIKHITGIAGCGGSLRQRIKAYCQSATPINEDQRVAQLSRWAFDINSLIFKRTSTLELKGQCPSCRTERTVYKKPGGAKAVGPCLVVVTDIDAQDSTAQCRACGAEWSRGQLHDLANAIA